MIASIVFLILIIVSFRLFGRTAGIIMATLFLAYAVTMEYLISKDNQ